jgi:hypothetical protein
MNISIVGRLCSYIGFGFCNDILVFFLKELIYFSIVSYLLTQSSPTMEIFIIHKLKVGDRNGKKSFG